MRHSRHDLGRGMRWLLILCGPMNLAGAICFAPPFPAGRQLLGLPEAPPLYLWILSSWVLAFGVAYLLQGWSGRASRGVLAVGAWGKAVFGAVLLAQSATGDLPWQAGAAAVPDLLLAAVFVVWLWRSRAVAPAVGLSCAPDRRAGDRVDA
ncbi:MAG: hypothetical protein Q8L86_16065 [Vicinamibacterales bacterium]|nr:hypothetical protein [Vicinamibacterales bacterium]